MPYLIIPDLLSQGRNAITSKTRRVGMAIPLDEDYIDAVCDMWWWYVYIYVQNASVLKDV